MAAKVSDLEAYLIKIDLLTRLHIIDLEGLLIKFQTVKGEMRVFFITYVND
jgi:hypothetical protein